MKNNKIIFFTNQMDTPENKVSGFYNLARLYNLKKLGYYTIIICPINIFPPPSSYRPDKFIIFVIRQLSIPFKSRIKSFKIYYPKYFSFPKKISWYSENVLMHIFCGRSIKKIIGHHKPDIIISSWLHPFATYAKYVKEYFNKPYISFCEGSDILIFPEKYNGWEKIQSIINNHVNRVILISKDMEKYVKEKRNLIKTQTIINGFREDLFYFKSPSTDTGKINLLTVGSLIHVKGYDILINALSKVKFNYELNMIGNGKEAKNINTLIKKFSIKGNVNSISFVEQKELSKHIHNCNIFCMPSRSEGLPATALEAMACGRPVVATAVGGLKDIIIDGFNGILVNPEDPTSYAKALTYAKNHDWDYKKISKWVKINFGWNKSIKELDALIQDEVR